MQPDLSDARAKFEELLRNIEASGLQESQKRDLRIEARETCLKLYQDNMDNATWWKKMYQKLMEVGQNAQSSSQKVKSEPALVEASNDELLPPV